MSMNSLSFVIFSYIVGHIIYKIGRRFSVYLGLLLTAVTMIGFGLLYWISDNTLFITLALLFRFIAGIGQALIAVASYSMTAIKYKDSLQQKMGLLEAGNGAGFFLGPVVGGIIYEFTHFWVPFFLSAVVLVLFVLLLKPHMTEDLDKRLVVQHTGEDLSYSYLLKHKRIIFASIAQFFNIFVLTFGQPIFGPRLEDDYHFPMAIIGLWFAIPTVAYVITGPFFLQILTKKFEFRATIMIGFLILFFGGIFIGPSKVFNFPDTSAPMMLTGLAILGMGIAWTIVPIIPEMIDAIEEKDAANDKVSAIFSVSGGLGQIVSPLLAGYLNDHISFNASLDVWAFSMLGFTFIYIIFWNGFSAIKNSFVNSFKKSKPISSEASSDVDKSLLSDSSDSSEIHTNCENEILLKLGANDDSDKQSDSTDEDIEAQPNVNIN